MSELPPSFNDFAFHIYELSRLLRDDPTLESLLGDGIVNETRYLTATFKQRFSEHPTNAGSNPLPYQQ